MASRSLIRSLALALLVPLLPACTTLQTTYFRGSYIELTGAGHPALQAAPETPRFAQVEDMEEKAHALHGEGYTMLGYSQFVSPLLPGLAESYSTKWARGVGAAYVALETPRPDRSNLHYYLATFWGKLKPGVAPFGVYLDGLPGELLAQVGGEDMLVVWQVIEDTPAEAAGLRADDVIVAVDGEHVQSPERFGELLRAAAGGELVLAVTRGREALELRAALPPRGAPPPAAPGFAEAPWRETQSSDWSALSVESLTAVGMQIYQEQERQRQAARQRALAYLDHRVAQIEAERAAEAAARARQRTATPRARELESLQLWKKVYRSPEALAKFRQRSVDVVSENAPFILQNQYQYRYPCRPLC